MPVPAVERPTQTGGEPGGGGTFRRIHGKGAVDELHERAWQVGAGSRERGGPAPDALCYLEEPSAAERMAVRERLPEHDPDRPDVGRGLGRLPGEPFRRDVRKRARNVAGGGERLLLRDECEPEVEEADGDPRPVGEQHVGRLHVAMKNPAVVRMREPLEHLRGGLDRPLVVELPVVEGVTEGAPRDVFVGDVHVSLVPRERVCAQASRMLELRGGSRLALGPRACGARPGHDLERDLASSLLVVGMPDRAHSAASERPQRPVAPEHEPARGPVSRRLRHPAETFRAAEEIPLRFKDLATVARIGTASGTGLMLSHETISTGL